MMSRSIRAGGWRAACACVLATIGTLVATAADAGAARPCSAPAVFQGAAVNSFVLPYRYVGSSPSDELRRAGRQLAALVHFELLFSMLKYGEVGATDLLEEPGQTCNPEEVIRKVSSGSGPGAMRPGQTLVIVWGRLFEQGNQLYLQTYVRFLRRGDKGPVDEGLSYTLRGAGLELPYRVGLPAQSLAFPPQAIGKADLFAIAREFGASMAVRPQPSLDVKGKSIDFEPQRPFPYYVTKTTRTPKEGDWMWLQPMADGPAGWVLARSADEAAGQWSLRRRLPELAYIDAIHGFMRLRANGGDGLGPARRESIRSSIDKAFTSFERQVSAERAGEAYGTARAIRGFVQWESAQDAAGRAGAAALFAAVREYMPEYAGAVNLSSLGRVLQKGESLDDADLRRLHTELLGAISLDPGHALALGNLDRLYRAAQARPAALNADAKQVKQRMAVVKSALDRAR
jgi:hypothetical protein